MKEKDRNNVKKGREMKGNRNREKIGGKLKRSNKGKTGP